MDCCVPKLNENRNGNDKDPIKRQEQNKAGLMDEKVHQHSNGFHVNVLSRTLQLSKSITRAEISRHGAFGNSH